MVHGQGVNPKPKSGMSGDFEKNLGQKIRVARQRAGLTQEDLAARISRTPESISNIERGQQEPGIKTVQSLANVLGLPLSELFESMLLPRSPELRLALRGLDFSGRRNRYSNQWLDDSRHADGT